jgi:hypothetical protein
MTRRADHWSQLVSDDNPRGYNEEQLQRIATAPTLAAKRKIELQVMMGRRYTEKDLVTAIADDFGIDRIAAMTEDIKADYAAQMAAAGDGGAPAAAASPSRRRRRASRATTSPSAFVAADEDYEDEDEEEEEDDDAPRPPKRYALCYTSLYPCCYLSYCFTPTTAPSTD